MVRSLKYAIIKPILKKSFLDPDVLTNYRPISQFPIIRNTMECVVSRQLINYLENNNLFDYFKSAYRKSFSTETALTYVTDLIHNSLYSSYWVQLLLIDLSNAFYLLNHSILINSIIKHGIEGSPIKWLMSFITNLTSSVKINDYISPPTKFLKGSLKNQFLAYFSSLYTHVLYLILFANNLIYITTSTEKFATFKTFVRPTLLSAFSKP